MVLAHGYVYTADGKLQSETLPSGVVVSYVYTQDKLSGISLDGQAYMSNIRYNAAGNVTSWQWADGTTYSKTYDANGKLQTFPLGNVTRTLSYDSVGNITGWDDNGDAAKAKHFSYDLLDRLEGYTAANETQAFQYDSNGNRTTKTDNGNTTVYGLQPNSNRLTQIGNVHQTLDANGNLLNDGAHSYTYNAQNRLVSVDGATTYGYNADDQRVKKTTQTGTTLYAWDNDHIIGEYTQGNQNSTAQATETIYFGNTPVAAVQNGNIYRIYADQIDTPRVITDATGKTVWSWESKPFGETAPNEDPDQDGLSLHYSQRFPGQTYDAETGLHYNFHRDYNPQTGRYVQSDPIGLGGGMNSFAYVKAMPLNFVDWEGLKLAYGSEAMRKYYSPLVDKIRNANATGKKLIDFITSASMTFTVYYQKGATGVLTKSQVRDMYIDNTMTYQMCARKATDPQKKIVVATANQLRIFTHELGHFAGGKDDGTGDMNNANNWENPIAQVFDGYIRTQYAGPKNGKCN